jgi:pimeloyl-ACP methyl ester carboxylesterase
MKLSKLVLFLGVFSAFITSNLFYSNSERGLAQSSTSPFIVFVNGSGDCCAGRMDKVIARAGGRQNVWVTSYANFRNGSSTKQVPVVNLSVNADALFIGEATKVINSLPPSRPVILIGHSYGGDSIIKILPFIKRRVQRVVVIDPVGTGGFRKVATSRVVPPNVDYFLNRWQENGLNGQNIVPFDSRISGQIRCSAKRCDQKAENLHRHEDGAEVRDDCARHEITCPGYQPWPGGSNGTKARRMDHNTMPENDYIQKTIVDALNPFVR